MDLASSGELIGEEDQDAAMLAPNPTTAVRCAQDAVRQVGALNG